MFYYIIHVAVSLFPLTPVERSRFTLPLDERLSMNKSAQKNNKKHNNIDGKGCKGEKPTRVVPSVNRVYNKSREIR